jgi:hypothetical protein
MSGSAPNRLPISQRFVWVGGADTPPASEVPSRTPSPQPSSDGSHYNPAVSTSTGPSCGLQLSDPEYCYIDFSDEMAAAEARLRLALVA